MKQQVLKEWKVDLKTADIETWEKLRALRDEMAGNKAVASKKRKRRRKKKVDHPEQ